MFAVNLGLQYTPSNLVQYVGQTKSLSIIVIQTVLLLTGCFKTPTAQIQKAILFLSCLIIGASPFFSTLALKILVLLSVRSILSKETYTYSMVGVRGSDFSTSFSWFVSFAVNFNLNSKMPLRCNGSLEFFSYHMCEHDSYIHMHYYKNTNILKIWQMVILNLWTCGMTNSSIFA
jgi:hypothetical protein